jgi:hypothetical protein
MPALFSYNLYFNAKWLSQGGKNQKNQGAIANMGGESSGNRM